MDVRTSDRRPLRAETRELDGAIFAIPCGISPFGADAKGAFEGNDEAMLYSERVNNMPRSLTGSALLAANKHHNSGSCAVLSIGATFSRGGVTSPAED